jgi:hypothetical protein
VGRRSEFTREDRGGGLRREISELSGIVGPEVFYDGDIASSRVDVLVFLYARQLLTGVRFAPDRSLMRPIEPANNRPLQAFSIRTSTLSINDGITATMLSNQIKNVALGIG